MNAMSGWVNLDPEPVPDDDPRVRTATLVADGAWLRTVLPPTITQAQRMRYVVRCVLAHLDELARAAQPTRHPTHEDRPTPDIWNRVRRLRAYHQEYPEGYCLPCRRRYPCQTIRILDNEDIPTPENEVTR